MTTDDWHQLAVDRLTVEPIVTLDPRPADEMVIASAWVSVDGGEWHRVEAGPIAVAAGEQISVGWALDRLIVKVGDRTVEGLAPQLDPSYDPDYDVTGPLDAMDRQLANERDRLAGERAERQTREWYDTVPRPGPARPDPTDILELPDTL